MSYESWRISYQSSEAAARSAYATTEKLHAELTALRDQLAAVGAGGVEPLRKPTQTHADARDVARWMGIGKAIERACMDLPDGTEISVSLEKGAGTVTLIDQDGNEHENFPHDYGFAGVLNEAIDAALAAQVKQEVQL